MGLETMMSFHSEFQPLQCAIAILCSNFLIALEFASQVSQTHAVGVPVPSQSYEQSPSGLLLMLRPEVCC